ncbi:MAG: MFS transporter [Woeseiaceae bacterium]
MSDRRILGIELSRGISATNLWAYFYAVLISSAYAGSLATLQPGVLQVMGIPFSEQGSLTGSLAAMQELLFIVLLGLVGAVSDKVGRKTVYVAGLLTTSLGFALYPTADSVAELVVYRIIVAIGSAAMLGMMVTVIADYSTNKTRGKANGVQGFIATLGAFVPPFLSALPAQFVAKGYTELAAQQATFAIAAALGVSAAIIAMFGLAPKATQLAASARESVGRILMDGARAARDKGIALSYGAAFISRGDLAVTGAFLGLWLVQHGMKTQGLTPSEAMASLVMPAILAVVAGALVGSILMGIVADRISRAAAIPVASGLAAAVYMSIFFVSDPTEGWVKGLLFIMGVAEISAFVSSQALVGQQAEPQHRGAIMGFFGVAGAFGILIGTKGGGFLFDAYGPSSPFVVFGFLNLVVFVWGLIVFRQVKVPDWSGSAVHD